MKHTLTLIASLMLACPLTQVAAQTPTPRTQLTGQDLDSGLGSLPPYREWHLHPQLKRFVVSAGGAVAGAKIDSGLGDLPPYSSWGRYPELRQFAAPALAGI